MKRGKRGIQLSEPCLVTTRSRDSRKIYQQAYGPLPSEIHVLHRCDNPFCRRLSHLFTGTRSDNMQDMHAKGRAMPKEAHPRALQHGRAKLTWEDVHAIRAAYPALPGRKKDSNGKWANAGLEETAAQYGVSSGALRFIIRGLTWKEAA